MRYRVVVHKILEDGTEIEMVNMVEPGWYASPVLKALARRVHEPAPVEDIKGQMALAPVFIDDVGYRNAA